MPAAASQRRRRRTAAADASSAHPVLPGQEGALAIRLLRMAREAGSAGLLHVAESTGRVERLAHLLWRLEGETDTSMLPPWDCLPFDRASPSARVMGLRVAALTRAAAPHAGPWILLATPDALVQRLPPRGAWDGRALTLSVGDAIDPEALSAALSGIGYHSDERVDEPGEFAVRGAVIDVFPAGYYLPVRIDHQDGKVTAIASFDADSQRTRDAFQSLHVLPISEAILTGEGGETGRREPGLEHRLPELYGALDTVFDYMPGARVSLEPGAQERAMAFIDHVREAHDSRRRFGGLGGRPLAPERLYLSPDDLAARLEGADLVRFAALEERDGPPVPVFAPSERPFVAARAFMEDARRAGQRVVVAGPAADELGDVARRLSGGQGTAEAHSWQVAQAAAPGELLTMLLPVHEGFESDGVTVIAVADILGSRARAEGDGLAAAARASLGAREESFATGDAVIHLEHGVGLLEGLEAVATGGRAGARDTIRLEYAGGAKLMVPVDDIERMWRYGAAREGLRLDRLGSDSWPKRRAKVEAEIGVAATALARLAAESEAARAEKLVPPARDYERFVAGFPFTETPDQHAAIDEILHDLASGRLMNRLVCGDVGFGKTEVALRAAAAAVLAGRQVAIAAPTTVLVRQHLETFARRFAPLGIEVAHLSRLTSPAEARTVKAGLESGNVRIVIGTHALAGAAVRFRELGLVVIDEEQRFGSADKDKLKGLGEGAHVLTMTATPIPRTLQAALVGLQAVSILATPPAERQPPRTVVADRDDATMREALLREQRRGGQSFVVCPRIEDIGPMAERLGELVPELECLVAHGRLKPDRIDEVMVRFASGKGDVLLATNIIESGLDVPRANTILVWRADRFGLAQLHQLRGRVGRGRRRGVVYLLTDPENPVAPATRKRLERLAGLDRLGAGFEVSAADLDSRGAGDLLGDNQAGHLKLIGAGLYRRLLERALVMARGDTPPDEWTPEINLDSAARIPEAYVPEADVRLSLYAEIARCRDVHCERRMSEEIADRFGPMPEGMRDLFALARLRELCREAGVMRVDAGPRAVALTFKNGRPDPARTGPLETRHGGALAWTRDRLVLAGAPGPEGRLAGIEAFVGELAGR